jgi:hypothetical protein
MELKIVASNAQLSESLCGIRTDARDFQLPTLPPAICSSPLVNGFASHGSLPQMPKSSLERTINSSPLNSHQRSPITPAHSVGCPNSHSLASSGLTNIVLLQRPRTGSDGASIDSWHSIYLPEQFSSAMHKA